MIIRQSKKFALVISAAILAGFGVAPAIADNVPPGLDYFFTPANVCTPPTTGSYLQLGVTDSPPIPAGFFGAGSQAFSGTICWQGAPLGGSFGLADTVIQRTGALTFAGAGCPCSGTCTATVPIEIVGLNLISIDPITVSFGGPTSTYSVRANLSTAPQIPGSMTVVHECLEGGTFSSNFQVIAKLTFTKISGASGLSSVVMDPAPASPPNPNFTVAAGVGRWSHTGAGFNVVPGSTFYPGIDWLPCDCNAGTPETAAKVLTQEQALWAAHGVQVENTDKPHLKGACDLPGTADCYCNISEVDCINLGGAYLGDHSVCPNPGTCIPTVSEWGVAALTLLMLTAATIVVKKRMAAA